MDYMIERLKAMKIRLEEIDKILSNGIADQKKMIALAKERSVLETPVSMYNDLLFLMSDKNDAELMMKDPDDEVKEMAKETFAELTDKIEEKRAQLQIALLPKDENDDKNVIMEIRGAAGGDEANIFAGDLYRMYGRYADKQGWKMQVLDSMPTALDGFSLISVKIIGKGAYSKLKFESGAHRVQRVPVTEANGRIQTSTATVLVMPELQHVNITINPSDLQIDTYHSSGAGGQNVNKTESAVRITHIPSGIVVSCQVERDQLANKETCMDMLKSKLFQIEEKKRQETISSIGGEKKEISFSSQIRSYVFCPYTLVKDHRTDYSEVNVQSVMDGNIQGFIDSYLRFDFVNSREIKNG